MKTAWLDRWEKRQSFDGCTLSGIDRYRGEHVTARVKWAHFEVNARFKTHGRLWYVCYGFDGTRYVLGKPGRAGTFDPAFLEHCKKMAGA